MPSPHLGMCKVCGWRKARYVVGTCQACDALVEAEGTREKYGVQKISPARIRAQEKANEYNALIRQGWAQTQIAQLWGLERKDLSVLVYRWKRDMGIKVVPANSRSSAPRSKVPVATVKTRPHKNEHGGGRWGIKGCRCDPCVSVRRVTQAEISKVYNRTRRRELVAQRREQKDGKNK